MAATQTTNEQALEAQLKSIHEVHLVALETFLQSETLLCKATFSDGTVGFGQCGNKDVDIICLVLHRRVVPALTGQRLTLAWNALELRRPRDLQALSPLMSRVVSFELNYKMMGVQLSKAVAGVDGAIWDALARKLKVPLFVLWRDLYLKPNKKLKSVPIYASSIARSIKLDDLLPRFKELKEQFGVRAFKMKVGERMGGVSNLDYDYDCIQRDIEQAFAKLGSDVKLSLDANGGFSSPAKLIEICKSTGIWFLEEPLPWFMNTLKSSERSSVKIAGGEQEFRMDCAKQTLSSNVFDIYQPDFGYSGGPSHVLMLCLAAKAGRTKIFPHSPQGDLHPIMALHMLLAQGDPDGHLEVACVDDGLRQVAFNAKGEFRPAYASSGGLKVEDGKCRLVDQDDAIVGWGITVNEAWLKRGCVHTRFDLASATKVVEDAKRSFL